MVGREEFTWRTAFVVGLMAVGCKNGGPRPPGPGEVPASVEIPGGTVNVAIATWRTQPTTTVGAFRISTRPVSVGEFAYCISAGACSQPTGTGVSCSTPGPNELGPTSGANAELPMACVTPTEAASFCRWVGGRLPRAAEWMLAARGPDPITGGSDGHPDRCVGDCSIDRYRLGQHPESTSKSGLQDVLIGRAELLETTADDGVPACRGQTASCAVFSFGGGTIDGFGVVVDADNPFGAQTFRCVWEKGQ